MGMTLAGLVAGIAAEAPGNSFFQFIPLVLSFFFVSWSWSRHQHPSGLDWFLRKISPVTFLEASMGMLSALLQLQFSVCFAF